MRHVLAAIFCLAAIGCRGEGQEPLTVKAVLAELERDVEAEPTGQVTVGGRIRLWDAMRAEYGVAEADLRRGALAYVLARDAVAKWDPRKISREDDPDGVLNGFPETYLETARRYLRGEVPRGRVREVFEPLEPFVNVVEVANKGGFPEMLYLGALLFGKEDIPYEREWFQVARKDDGSYRKIVEKADLPDVHEMVAIAADVPLQGKDHAEAWKSPARVAARRAFWLRWIRETVPRVLGTHESVLALLGEPEKATKRP